MSDLSKYFPCTITCVEDVDGVMSRTSCRHGVFCVVWGDGHRMVTEMCRTRRAMKLLDDHAAGLVKVDDANRKILRQHRLIP